MAAASARDAKAGLEDSPLGAAAAKPPSRKRAAAAVAGDDDEDDAWADRLWQDMQEHRRQAAAAKAAAAHRPGSTRGMPGAQHSRDEAVRERERKAAAAAAESARILKEEQAKDADWRAAMMRQVEQVRPMKPHYT